DWSSDVCSSDLESARTRAELRVVVSASPTSGFDFLPARLTSDLISSPQIEALRTNSRSLPATSAAKPPTIPTLLPFSRSAFECGMTNGANFCFDLVIMLLDDSLQRKKCCQQIIGLNDESFSIAVRIDAKKQSVLGE